MPCALAISCTRFFAISLLARLLLGCGHRFLLLGLGLAAVLRGRLRQGLLGLLGSRLRGLGGFLGLGLGRRLLIGVGLLRRLGRLAGLLLLGLVHGCLLGLLSLRLISLRLLSLGAL